MKFFLNKIPIIILVFSALMIFGCKKIEQNISEQPTNQGKVESRSSDFTIVGESGTIYEDWNMATGAENAVALHFKSDEISSASNYCCEVYWHGYFPPPFPIPGNPSLITFKTRGYNTEEATGYFFHYKILRFNTDTQEWEVFHDHLWLDFERECDGSTYFIGLQIDLGVCPAMFRVFGAKGHYNQTGQPVYCTGASGEFYYPGNPQICLPH